MPRSRWPSKYERTASGTQGHRRTVNRMRPRVSKSSLRTARYMKTALASRPSNTIVPRGRITHRLHALGVTADAARQSRRFSTLTRPQSKAEREEQTERAREGHE